MLKPRRPSLIVRVIVSVIFVALVFSPVAINAKYEPPRAPFFLKTNSASA